MGTAAESAPFSVSLILRRAGAAVLLACLLALLPLYAGAANKKPPAQPVNLNTATSEELQQVPGIGPVTAEKIIRMRRAYGRFKRVDDLLSIKGIGRKRLEKMRKYLTVSGPARPEAEKPAAAPPPADSPDRDKSPNPPLLG